MSKFNQNQTIRTTNKNRYVAYSMADKSKLVTQVLTSFFNESKFYGDNSANIQNTIKRVIEHDAEFVAKLAVFARREFNMRSVSHILVSYLAHEPNGKQYANRAIKAVCLRGDDATEIMSCYIQLFGKPIPNSLRRALKSVLERFDEYTLAKYKGSGKSVKMRDLLCLCRPKPKNEAQSIVWKKLLEGTLEPPMTWEVELSKNGNNRETWERLIASEKVGYMALLRNLRNIIKTNPSNIDAALNRISDAEFVRKSKQLPFRFLSAYKSVCDVCGSKVLDALETAVEVSIENMPKLNGTTVIAVDVSGSMSSKVSAKSSVSCVEIGYLLGLIANKICENSYFYTFNARAQKVNVSARSNIIENAVKAHCFGGTNMYAPFKKMISDGVKADRVIVISDNECNLGGRNGSYPVQVIAEKYREVSGMNTWVHAIDLQGYGTQQFHGNRTNIIAGWSEKVFDFIRIAEQGEGTLEKEIEEYSY